MDFPIHELLDEKRSYQALLQWLHPEGLRCPHGHALPTGQAPHDSHRAPILDYRCRDCGAVFNLFTGTVFLKTRLPCSKIVLILRGFSQGTSTAQLARELMLDRGNLLELRHRAQERLVGRFPPLSTARRGGGGRRTVPERGREGHSSYST